MSPPALVDAQILIVDDMKPNVILLERILQRAGFCNVASTTDPRRTFSLCAELRPALILLDLQMPHMDGYAVMSRLKAEQTDTTYVPILVLTANITPEAKHAALSLGAKDFVTKPFNATEVLLRVRNLLQTSAVHLELERRIAELERPVTATDRPSAVAQSTADTVIDDALDRTITS